MSNKKFYLFTSILLILISSVFFHLMITIPKNALNTQTKIQEKLQHQYHTALESMKNMAAYEKQFEYFSNQISTYKNTSITQISQLFQHSGATIKTLSPENNAHINVTGLADFKSFQKVLLALYNDSISAKVISYHIDNKSQFDMTIELTQFEKIDSSKTTPIEEIGFEEIKPITKKEIPVSNNNPFKERPLESDVESEYHATPEIRIRARVVYLDIDYEKSLGLLYQGPDSNNDSQFFRIYHNKNLDVALAALEQSGHAKIISRPNLITLNNQMALIQSGEQIPYQSFAERGVTSTEFKNAVLALHVKPELQQKQRILLDLKINQDVPSTQTVLGVPTIHTREIKTRVVVHSGHTVVLGGIYETSNDHTKRQVPILGHIPLLGHLFKYNAQAQHTRELLIFVTPSIEKDV
ncbi:MAG: hypothetical protein ACE365_06580 [Gammaproteobacteria bacterium]